MLSEKVKLYLLINHIRILMYYLELTSQNTKSSTLFLKTMTEYGEKNDVIPQIDDLSPGKIMILK